MKANVEDRIKGKFHEIKGSLKEKAARAAGNPEQEEQGREEKSAGAQQTRRGVTKKVSEP